MARKKNDTQINRRTVLKNLGVAGVLAAGFAGTSAAKSTPDRKVVIKGDLDTPISFDAISTAAMDLGNEYDRDMAIPRPLDYGDAEIVAFLMYIKDNGVPSYYVGAVPKKAEQAGTTNQVSLSRSPSVAARHAELDRRLAELQERSSKKLSRISTNNTASTNASAGGFLPDSEWRKYSDGTVEIGACPYGRYNHTVDVWGYQDTYATGSKVAIFPGVNECGSKGMNNIQTIRHLWSEGDFEDSPTVQDFQPSGGVDGQITGTSLTVGYGTVGVGFSYQ